MYFMAVVSGLHDDNWATADSIVNYISKFQNRYGANVMPSDWKIKLEITYNKMGLFANLFMSTYDAETYSRFMSMPITFINSII